MPSSRPIVTGEDYTADDINNLRDDVLSGHTHDGSDGTKIPFSNLDVTGTGGSTAPATGAVSYDNIETHLAATQNAHGLGASSYVLGSHLAGLAIQGGYSAGTGSQTINFPIQFKEEGSAVDPISIVVTIKTSHSDPFSNTMGVTITELSSTAFTADVDGSNVAGLFWMAMGYIT